MRQIGNVATESQAQRLIDVLLAEGIKSQAEPANDGWLVWVYDEDRVAQARTLLERFQSNPDDPGFASAGTVAERLRTEAIARDKRIRKNIVDVRSRWNAASAAGRPLTILLIAISVVVGLLTKFGASDAEDSLLGRLTYVSYAPAEIRGYIRMNDPFGPHSDFLKGEVWRVVTPIFLHFGPLHLLFNMMWLHSLGSMIEMRRGSVRFALLIAWLAVTSNTAQYVWSGPSFGGMSGVVFGLFGYVWIKSRVDPSSGMYIDPRNVFMMFLWLAVCMTGQIGPIANTAHLVGLIGGVVVAFAPFVWRRVTGR